MKWHKSKHPKYKFRHPKYKFRHPKYRFKNPKYSDISRHPKYKFRHPKYSEIRAFYQKNVDLRSTYGLYSRNKWFIRSMYSPFLEIYGSYGP